MLVRLAGGTTRFTANQVPMIFMTDDRWTLRNFNGGTAAGPGFPGICTAGTHATLNFNNAADPTGYNLAAGVCGGYSAGTCGAARGNACCSTAACTAAAATCNPAGVLYGEIIRYRIRPGTDGVPNLERWSSGNSGNFSAGVPQFQAVARGIDDLQVQYADAAGTVADNAPVIVNGVYTSPITRVTVTLSARSEARNVVGARTVTSGPAALRGSLTSSATPRAALATLGGALAPRASGSPPPWF
jgi:hypothetical protein